MVTEAKIRLSLDGVQPVVGGLKQVGDKIGDVSHSISALTAIGGALSIGAFAGWIKGAIDAADHLNDLSKSTGLTVEKLSGLKLAAQQSGSDLDGVAKSINKLSVNMAKDAEKFAKLGVTAKDPLEAFKQLSDIFVAIQDPQLRAAVGAEALGKSWETAAPLLAEGGKNIGEMIEKGQRLSQVTAETTAQADKFNDQLAELKTISGGLGMKLAGEMLPALTDVASAVTTAYTESGKLMAIWVALGGLGAFLFTDEFSNATTKIKNLQIEIGQFEERKKQLNGGGYLQYWLFGSQGELDAKIASARGQIKGLQDEMAKPALDAAAKAKADAAKRASDEAAKKAAAQAADFLALNAEAAKTTAAEIEKENAAYLNLTSSIKDKIDQNELEITLGGTAIESAKLRIKLERDLASGKLTLTAAHKAGTIAEIDALAVSEKRLAAYKAEIAIVEERVKQRQAEADSIKAYFEEQQAGYTAAVKASSDALKAAQDEYAQFGLSKSEIAKLTLAQLQLNLAKFNGADADNAGAIAAQQQIDKQIELIGVLQKTEVKQQYKDIFDSIDSTAHDTFISIFDSGKSAFDRLRDTLKNGLLDLLYQMTVKKWILNIGATVSASGAAGVAQAAGVDGGSFGSVSNLLGTAKTLYSTITGGFASLSSSMGSMVTSAGEFFGSESLMNVGFGMQGAGGFGASSGAAGLGSSIGAALPSVVATVGGYMLGSAISGKFAAFGNANIANAGGAIIGTILGGPIGGVIGGAIGGLVNRAFGMGEKELRGKGIEGTFGATGFAGNTFADWHQDGGWFRSDRNGHDTDTLDAATGNNFSDLFLKMRAATGVLGATLGLSADELANFSQSISVTLTDDAKKNEELIAGVFAGIGDTLARTVAPGIDAFGKEGETASATLQRLSTSLTAANAWLSMLGQRVFQIGLIGGDAASKLADVFGGLDNLNTASAAFYQTYYTEGERAARSQQDMTAALAKVNLALPTSKDQLRAMALSLDLNTESGREAYATLLALAPEFATVSDATAKMAQDTADQLLVAFTGRGRLQPALDAATLKTLILGDTLVSTYTAAGSISTLFLNVNSGLITFGTRTSTLTNDLTGAQQASALLNDQISILRLGATGTKIDMQGLSAALNDVNTETFIDTISNVFTALAERIKGVIGDIASERIATREAALQIINPTVMSKEGIERGIAGINTGLPSNAGIVGAQGWLQSAEAQQRAATSAANISQANAQTIAQTAATANAQLTAATAAARNLDATAVTIFGDDNFTGGSNAVGVGYSDSSSWGIGNDTMSSIKVAAGYIAQVFQNGTNDPGNSANYTGNTASVGYWMNDEASSIIVRKIAENAFDIAARQATLALADANAQLAQSQQAAATDANAKAAADNNYAAAAAYAKTQQLAYADALQNFAIDASNSVDKLSKLREETVKYYDAQKALADLMGKSAAGLRSTVADYRYGQMGDAQQLDNLQSQYATAYAMALSTDGETLASYGDKLNSLLNPMLDKARDVLSSDAYNAFAGTAIARAENIAGRLEALTPTNYSADSLALLGTIDSTLAALDSSARSAEQLIVNAIDAGRDKTADGLHAVVAALTGQAIPAFAGGGDFGGGLRLVGEHGPELEVTGAARIFNADQTRNLLAGGGNNAEIASEIRALREDSANMRVELRAIATTNAKMARLAERTEQDGMLVRSDADTPIHTVPA